MNRIKQLDIKTINKIAAGEVVERPSSVVKELVENSIDAGADRITIEIKEGGIALIRVSDNGRGIAKQDAKLAFIRHATNKIERIEDLEEVLSLGFRGEALASIAAVSQLEMTTKTEEDLVGTVLEIHGGEFLKEAEAACLNGTTISMHNLFYNIPARRKFLKRPGTESGYIADIIYKMALGHPEISFKYMNNGALLLHTSGNHDLRSAVLYVYGKDMAQKMLPLSYHKGQKTLSGLIGKPELVRANRSYENLFINGRFIKSSLVASAVEDAYKNRLMIGKFPIFVLNLTIPPTEVDVNVHPTKLEVRFSDEDAIYQFFYQAVLSILQEEVLIPKGDWDSKLSPVVAELVQKTAIQQKEMPVQKETEILIEELPPPVLPFDTGPTVQSLLHPSTGSKAFSVRQNSRPYKCKYTGQPGTGQISENSDISFDEQQKSSVIPQKNAFFQQYKIVGQIFQTYWIVEQGESIFLIDQHAAHERVLFEEFLTKLQQAPILSQRLLEPVIFHISEAEQNILSENEELLLQFGFEAERLENGTYALTGVPQLFQTPQPTEEFLHILDLLGSERITNMYDTKLHMIATMACKAAVKAHDKLDFMEARTLIERLLKLTNPFTCPHGRPTIIEMTKYELEKKFKRIQS